MCLNLFIYAICIVPIICHLSLAFVNFPASRLIWTCGHARWATNILGAWVENLDSRDRDVSYMKQPGGDPKQT